MNRFTWSWIIRPKVCFLLLKLDLDLRLTYEFFWKASSSNLSHSCHPSQYESRFPYFVECTLLCFQNIYTLFYYFLMGVILVFLSARTVLLPSLTLLSSLLFSFPVYFSCKCRLVGLCKPIMLEKWQFDQDGVGYRRRHVWVVFV